MRMTTAQIDTLSAIATRPERAAIVLEETLAPGFAANAASILALTLGARLPDLPGPPVIDADGVALPGLYPSGLPVLRASADQLVEMLQRAIALARAMGDDVPPLGVIALPAAGQRTTDYEQFRASVAATSTAELAPVGVLVCGSAKPLRKLTGSFGLLR